LYNFHTISEIGLYQKLTLKDHFDVLLLKDQIDATCIFRDRNLFFI